MYNNPNPYNLEEEDSILAQPAPMPPGQPNPMQSQMGPNPNISDETRAKAMQSIPGGPQGGPPKPMPPGAPSGAPNGQPPKPPTVANTYDGSAPIGEGALNKYVSDQIKELGKPTAEVFKTYGVSPKAPVTEDTDPSFFGALKKIVTDAKVDPDSPEGIATKAYYGALVKGAGVKGAADLYANTYKDLVTTNANFAKDLKLKLAQKELDQYEQKALATNVATEAVRGLSKMNLPVEDLQHFGSQVMNIQMLSKDRPEQATAASQTLLNQARQRGLDDKQITALAKNLYFKPSPEMQKRLDLFEQAGVSESLRNQYVWTNGFRDGSEDSDSKLAMINKKLKDFTLQNKQDEINLDIDKHRKTKGIDVAMDIEKERTLTGAEPGEGIPEAKARKAGYAEVAKDAGKIIADRPVLEKQISEIRNAVSLLESGDTNFGTPVNPTQGIVGQTVGNLFNTQQSQNTKEVLAAVQQLVLAAGAQLKGSLSDKDVAFIKENKPTVNDSPEFAKKQLEKIADYLENKIKTAEIQLKSGGSQVGPSPVAPGTGVTTRVLDGKTYVYDGIGWKLK